MIDEIKDTMDYSREINDILSQPIDDTIIIDDDVLLKELAAYTGGSSVDAVKINLPEVSVTLVTNMKTDKEETSYVENIWNTA